jgi:hypothetical protein
LRPFLGALALASLLLARPAGSEIFHSRESALELAFPGKDRVEARDLFLSESDVREIEGRARVNVDSRLVTVYVGYRGEELLGYAYFDTHTVRTLPETLLLDLHPDGSVDAVHILAFHEPAQYLTAPPWLEQFENRVLDDELWLDRGVAALAGSTLSARSVTAAVRRLLAVHEVKIGGATADPAAGGATP